jgi:streptomycin 6-kinase
VVPDSVARALLATEGETGREWIRRLPRVLRDVERRWGLQVGPPFLGGAVAFVAPAVTTAGERVVLKVSILTDETRHEGDTLELWNGDGAVRLLDADPERGALLLERAEPGHSLEDHPDRAEAVRIACGILRRLRRPPPAGHPFQRVTDLARRWTRELPGLHQALGRPFEEALVAEASDTLSVLAGWSGDEIVANRDFHLGNVLAARREPWLAIDPKPLVGEAAFDTGYLLDTLLRDHPDPAEATGWIAVLARDLELDPDRIRAWAFARAVENVLWALEYGFPFEGDLLRARALRAGGRFR